MDGKVNTPCRACKAITIGTLLVVAAIAVAAIIGCASMGERRRQNIAAVIQTAYDMGGREAVSNKIESLVAEGKLTPSQAVRLHALAQLAYEGLMDDLATGDAVTNAAPASASQGGCTDCSLPDASAGCGECNEDARCDKCADCMDGK